MASELDGFFGKAQARENGYGNEPSGSTRDKELSDC
jgi:hypothetical protein